MGKNPARSGKKGSGDSRKDNIKLLLFVLAEPTGAGSQKQLLSGPNKGGTMAVDGNDYGDTRCSLWACFGWNGLDRAKRFSGVPPSARVGWWRTIDFVLVLAVAACSITTFSVDWDYRVVHACQGLVILRWLPLLRCPLRPAPGHADLHDVGGATVHDQPLDNNTRHKVLQETLGLLRGQNKLAAMVDRNMAQDDGADLTSAFSAAGHTMLRKGSIAEEKEDGDDGEAGDIANVGVAVALREACAAHPELVQSHGPLSAPILRAMLGLDPHKNGEGHNDVQDFNVTAKAVALARGFQRADSSVAGDAATPGRANLRRQSSRAGRGAPPSPARRSNSSSSSELSSSEEEGERLARKGSNASHTVRASRARVSSWIGRGGSRHSRTSEASQSYQQHQHQQHMMFQQQQQQLMYQQQQQMQLHYQLQQQQRASQQDLMSSMEGGGTAAAGMPLHTGPLLPQMPHGYMGAPYAGVGAVGAYGLAAPLPMPSFDHPSASGGGGGGFSGSSHSRSKPVRRGRSRSSRHRRSGHSGDVVVPPAVEDIERPVLRSFASDAGSQHGGGGLHSAAGTPRAGAAGLSIPFGSGRSIPFSSSHRAARSGPKERGTPGRATAAARHQHRRSLSQDGGPDSGGESDILGRAATEAAEATVATASASTSSQQGLDMVVPGSSDATVEGSAASGGEEGSATPAVGKSAAGSAFAGKDGKAE